MKNRILALLAFALLLAGCDEQEATAPTVQVVVDQVVSEPYQPQSTYVGRLQAKDDVAIQAKVTGYLASREFREGELVEAGDVLYTIDDSEYVAALARAKAQMASATAAQANAERNHKRGKELLPKGAISQAEMDDLLARKLDADAQIESARAQVTSAEVNLSYTVIKAPISGRIGRSTASVGDLVGPNTGNLTTLVSIDPIEALFQISEATYVSTVGQHMGVELTPDSLRSIEVTLELADGTEYPEIGRIDYFANRIDSNTGTLEARAEIPNPHSILVPGQYVRVILQDTNPLEGLFMPQAAVQADQQGAFVLVVDEGSVVRRHNVDLGDRFGQHILVRKGVEAGQRVIVRGLQQVRPGMPVQVKELPESSTAEIPGTDGNS